jgi:(p)ppGpp synthase/HD superfamily hydrolase
VSDSVLKAQSIAEFVHASQVDKAGKLYIDHCRRVVERTKFVPGFEAQPTRFLHDAKIVAWLHDVLEDSGEVFVSPVLESDLVMWGFSQQVSSAVKALSRVYWTSRDLATKVKVPDQDYYSVVKDNPLAKLVKLADLADNTNLARVAVMEASGGRVRAGKYDSAIRSLDLSPEQLNWLREDNLKFYN